MHQRQNNPQTKYPHSVYPPAARAYAAGIAALLFLFSGPLSAWGNHYTVTDRSLRSKSTATIAEQEVTVESMDAFLQTEKDNLAALFKDYYGWLKSIGHKRFKPQTFDPARAGKAEFIKATRMNPNTIFPMVRRVLPDEQTAGNVNVASVSPYIKESPNLRTEFVVVESGTMKLREVVATFADEPDWGMDHKLFIIPEYGFGKQPYGKAEGESSKAPIHTQFNHENFVVNNFASDITEGMAVERAELFLRLSVLALKNGHDYWGYRFMAWALHYLQDLCQPYHSKAVPFAGFWYYLKFTFSFYKEEIKAETTQLLANRHFGYEDFVAFALEQSYLKPDDQIAAGLVTALQTEVPLEAGETGSLKAMMRMAMLRASEHASDIDSAIVESFGPKYTEDSEYDLETDKDYSVGTLLQSMDRVKGNLLLKETTRDFALTGTVTRRLLELVRKAAGKQ